MAEPAIAPDSRDPEEVFLTSAELAERWRLSTGTLANWRASRIGPDFLRLADKHGPVLYRLSEVLRRERCGTVKCDPPPTAGEDDGGT